MTFADGKTVESVDVLALEIRLGFGAEIVAEILPVIAALIICAERAAGVVTTVDHAVFAARIASDAIDHAVFVPIDLLQHLLVGAVMAVGHQITRRFPTANIPGRDGPGGAG